MKKCVIDESSGNGRSLRIIILTMKLLTILMFTGTMALSAGVYSQKTKIDLQFQNSTVGDILKSIESNSEFIFVYDTELVNTRIEKSISVKDAKIETILNELFGGSNIAYLIDDRQVFLYKKDDLKQLEHLTSEMKVEQPQKKQLKGKVTDSHGVLIPGATVHVKGTTIGTSTNFDGLFMLDVPVDSKVLTISFVGYTTREIPIGNQTTYDVILNEAVLVVDDVVVMGYGVQKKKSVIAAISTVSNEQLERSGNISDLKLALAGQLPGLVTVTSSGEPGGAGRFSNLTKVYIRGENTWNAAEALILVDGIERRMDMVAVEEVDNITILKDASATAVFGTKGAAGVILITTKRGSVSKPKISFSYNSTAITNSKLPSRLDSYNAILVRNQAIENELPLNEPSWGDYIPNEIANRYKLPQNPSDVEIFPNVDWTKAWVKKWSFTQKAALNVQGGTEFVKYFTNFTYQHEGDMFNIPENNRGYKPDFSLNRFNFRSNLDFKVTNTTNLKLNISGDLDQKDANWVANVNSMWVGVYAFAPDVFLPKYADGTWGYKPGVAQNPVALNANLGIKKTYLMNLNSDFVLEQNLDFITNGLKFTAGFYYDNSVTSEGGIYDTTSSGSISETANVPIKYINRDLYTGPNQDPREYTTYYPIIGTNQFDWVIKPWVVFNEWVPKLTNRRLRYQGQLDYARKFGKHNVSALALFKREEFANGEMFRSYREDWVSRVTYDYESRYLAEINGAYNGSEAFGPKYRFGFFPSAGLAWVVSNEKFFKVGWMNHLKLRASIGKVGDDRAGGRWLYDDAYRYGNGQTTYNARLSQNPQVLSPYTFYTQSAIGNPEIHWEEAVKQNYALELGLFKNLITVNYEYFTEDRTNMLIPGANRAIPPFFSGAVAGYVTPGAAPPMANMGHVTVHGHELEVKLDKRTEWGLRYWSTFSWSHIKNKVLFKDDPLFMPDYQKQAGYKINQYSIQVNTGFNNNWDDVYASVPQETADQMNKLPGYYNMLDFNADGLIRNSQDGVKYGYSLVPENTFSTMLGADYKGFSVMVQFYGETNVTRGAFQRNFDGGQDIVFSAFQDYWTKDNLNANAFLPRWKTGGSVNLGSYWTRDGSYLRLKTAEIAYTFQGNWVKKAKLGSLRLYLNGNNLALWTKLPDDREEASSSGYYGAYPVTKRINLGVDVTF